eukprot:1930-Heterococcus_DN1.PRE.2
MLVAAEVLAALLLAVAHAKWLSATTASAGSLLLHDWHHVSLEPLGYSIYISFSIYSCNLRPTPLQCVVEM